MDYSFEESDCRSDSSRSSYNAGCSKLKDLLSRAKLKLAELPDVDTLDKGSVEKSRSLDQVAEPPSSWRELPPSRNDFTAADARDDSNHNCDSEDQSVETWESSDDDSVADVADIEDDEVFTTETASSEIRTMDKEEIDNDTNPELRARLLDLLEQVESRKRMRSPTGYLDKPIDTRAGPNTLVPTKKKVTFALSDDDPISHDLTEKSHDSYGGYCDYSNTSLDEFRSSDDGHGDSVRQGDDRLKAKIQELNTTPTVLGSLISRTQTPGPKARMFDNEKLRKDDDVSDTLSSDSDENLALNLAVYARPSPIGSPFPGKASIAEDVKLDKSSKDVRYHNELMLDDSDRDDLELCFDSDEERDVPTRSMSRWDDDLQLEMNSGRRSARPKTSDFFDDESDYEDDFRDNALNSDDSELCISCQNDQNTSGDSPADTVTLSSEVSDDDKIKDVTKDSNQSCAALEMWHAGMQNRTVAFLDGLDSICLREDKSQINPFTNKRNVDFVEDIRIRDDKSPEVNLGLTLHGYSSSKKSDVLKMSEMKNALPVETSYQADHEKYLSENKPQGHKSPRNKKRKKKKKAAKKTANQFLNMFPGNSYVLFNKPLLPPIQERQSWRSNSPPQTPSYETEKKIPESENKDPGHSSNHSSSGETMKQGDALILEKAIAKINDCNKDLGQKFVPIDTDVFDGPENPALKPLETHSLRVVKFRAQFNKNTTLLPELDKADKVEKAKDEIDNRIVKFVKHLKQKINPDVEIIDKAEKRRKDELGEYEAKMRAVREETEKKIEEQNALKIKGKQIHSNGYKTVDAEYDRYSRTDMFNSRSREYANHGGHNDTKLLKRQPGRIHIGNDFGKQEQANDSRYDYDVFERDREEYVDRTDVRDKQFDIKGWEVGEGSQVWSYNKREKYDNSNMCVSRNLYPEQPILNQDRPSTCNVRDMPSAQGTIKVHSYAAIALDNHENPKTKKFRECIKQPLIPPTSIIKKDKVQVSGSGAMKAFTPFSVSRQEEENIINKQSHAVPVFEQGSKVDHNNTSSRLLQASGLQKEAVRPPQAPSTGKPSDSKMMRHRFQRLFNKMVKG